MHDSSSNRPYPYLWLLDEKVDVKKRRSARVRLLGRGKAVKCQPIDAQAKRSTSADRKCSRSTGCSELQIEDQDIANGFIDSFALKVERESQRVTSIRQYASRAGTNFGFAPLRTPKRGREQRRAATDSLGPLFLEELG